MWGKQNLFIGKFGHTCNTPLSFRAVFGQFSTVSTDFYKLLTNWSSILLDMISSCIGEKTIKKPKKKTAVQCAPMKILVVIPKTCHIVQYSINFPVDQRIGKFSVQGWVLNTLGVIYGNEKVLGILRIFGNFLNVLKIQNCSLHICVVHLSELPCLKYFQAWKVES